MYRLCEDWVKETPRATVWFDNNESKFICSRSQSYAIRLWELEKKIQEIKEMETSAA